MPARFGRRLDIAPRSMLARTPAPRKKRRYRRCRDGICVLYVEVKEAECAEALLTARYLTERQALRRDQLTREAKDILEQFIDRWRHQHPNAMLN
jgi:hypothetical protein